MNNKKQVEIWTSEIEKTKKGYYWIVYEMGKQVASGLETTKRKAQNEIGKIIYYYKTTTAGQKLLKMRNYRENEK